ncbi:MAG TPA: hypothetical protein VIY86_01740, partial [Pirellulaceae bacterium]
ERNFRPSLFGDLRLESFYHRGGSSLDYRRSVYVDYYAPTSWSGSSRNYAERVLYSSRGLDASRTLYSHSSGSTSVFGSNSSASVGPYVPSWSVPYGTSSSSGGSIYPAPPTTYATGYYYDR